MDNFKYKQWLNSYSLGWSNTLNIDKRTNRKEFFEFVLVDVSIILISFTKAKQDKQVFPKLIKMTVQTKRYNASNNNVAEYFP